ncbi:MAG: replication/maintenance protein RepL [Clostridia bacterium]|nr:replication/maintenance protein RepL [Clostridia bacterium]
MIEISKFDLLIFDDKQIQKISKAMLLLNLLIAMSNERNVVKVTKTKIADALSKSIRTITSWILVLCGAGAIKYKYTGEYRINPKFYFKGSLADYEETLVDWQNFKSDVKYK